MRNFKQKPDLIPLLDPKSLAFRLKLLANRLPFPPAAKNKGCRICQSSAEKDTLQHFLKCPHTFANFRNFYCQTIDNINERLHTAKLRILNIPQLLQILGMSTPHDLSEPQGQGVVTTKQIDSLKSYYDFNQKQAKLILFHCHDAWLTELHNHIWLPRCRLQASRPDILTNIDLTMRDPDQPTQKTIITVAQIHETLIETLQNPRHGLIRHRPTKHPIEDDDDTGPRSPKRARMAPAPRPR